VNTPLRSFALISILIHGLAGFLPAALSPRVEHTASAGAEPLQVELHDDKYSRHRRMRPEIEPGKAHASLNSSLVSALAESDDVAIPRNDFPVPDRLLEKTVTTDSSPAPKTDPDAITAAARQSLQERLTSQLARNFHYPWVARLRGWQGEVQLAFRVAPDGELQHVHVARSSGYAVLDDSALNSLKRLGNLVDSRIWLEGQSLDMQIPVKYKLIEN
jgi:protein TonB